MTGNIYKRGTVIEITGKPTASFTFFDLLSWNRLLNMHFRSKGGAIAKMNKYGYDMAIELQNEMDTSFGTFLVNRAFVLVKVIPPKEEISDIHNVCLKAIFDGFTSADIWADDEWAHVPFVGIMWAGIDNDVQWRVPKVKTKTKRGKLLRGTDGQILLDDNGKKMREPSRQIKTKKARMRRTIIEIHELAAIIINGRSQELPMGRTRV